MSKSASIASGLDALLSNSDARSGNNINSSNKKGQKLNDGEEKATSSLSLNDLETVSNIPSKDLNNKNNRHHNNHHHHDNYESSGFVRVIKSSSSSNNATSSYYKANGDVSIGSINGNNLSTTTSSNNKQRSSSKHSKHPKAPPVESDYELDISDSEESTASSSRLDNSPKSNRNTTSSNSSIIDNLQCKLKDEQIARLVEIHFSWLDNTLWCLSIRPCFYVNRLDNMIS